MHFAWNSSESTVLITMIGIDRNGLSLLWTIFMSSRPSTSGIMMSVKTRSIALLGSNSASIASWPFVAVVTVG